MFRASGSRKALWLVAAALSFCLVSCGPSTEFFRGVDDQISSGNYASAIDGVRKNRSSYGDKSTVLYKLDMGLLYHYGGMPDSSTPYLLAAEKEIEDLYTKSISLAAVSMVLNDNVLPYEGEDFEKVLVNIFLALNFAAKSEADEAIVEARKVDLKLREYSKQYGGKNKYQEDAFIRYIAGVLYEHGGEINDAFISYRKAYEAYQTYRKEYGTSTPSFLLDDLVRTATLLSFPEEAAAYKAAGGRAFDRKGKPYGSIVLVAYVGKGPVKQEVRPTVSIPDVDGVIHTFQMALPKFVPRYKGTRTYRVSARATHDSAKVFNAVTEVAENVTKIAYQNLEDRLGLVYLKSGGRALLKFLAAEEAKSKIKKGEDATINFLGSLGIDLLIGASEQADLRTWRTLPSEFQIARLNLLPGDYSLHVSASDDRYTLPGDTVHVRSGKTSLIIVDDVR